MSRPRQLCLPGCEPSEPRLTAKRDLSAAAFKRALTRIGVSIGAREVLSIDDNGRRYDVVCRRDPLCIVRRLEGGREKKRTATRGA